MLYDQWLVRAHKWDLTVLSQKSRYALLAQLVEQPGQAQANIQQASSNRI